MSDEFDSLLDKGVSMRGQRMGGGFKDEKKYLCLDEFGKRKEGQE